MKKLWTTESEYLDLLAAGQVLSFVEMPACFASGLMRVKISASDIFAESSSGFVLSQRVRWASQNTIAPF
jgi:hypothetical protein